MVWLARTVAYRSASRLYVRAVNFPALTTFFGAGVMGTKARLGGEGAGRTRLVAMEKVLPSSP
jgi:hypothetical protein